LGVGGLASSRRKGWDMGLDYEWARKKLLRALREAHGKERVYISILYIQLVNALRVKEAIRAFQYFLRTRKREFEIEAQKGGRLRPVFIPLEIHVREEYKWVLEVDLERMRRRLYWHARRILGVNTHSLRYALVGYLGRKGVAAQVIAKITGHKKLDRIIDYTQEQLAREILRELAGLKR